ncbi:hypothetical protein [Burkholderia gladioli]|uniref:hypothetical protein n=1 Tax=Burkholderia gladioli TaxID=28095 RepID=UPI0016406378|nr:hypothetical protein [Burkholderia gladioli]
MMTLEQYLLVKIGEEASEIAQMAAKCSHFGLTETEPGRTENNGQRMNRELNDLLAMVRTLQNIAGRDRYSFAPDESQIMAKIAKVDHYLTYSRSLGLVEPA